MANPKSGPNSSAPTTGAVTAGVYNATQPVLTDGQACPIQVDVNGKLITSGSGGGGANVNISGVNGATPALANPLPVELSDGSQAFGTVANPINVAGSISATNPSVGTDGSAAPGSSTQVGGSDGTNLQPLQVDASKNLKVLVNAALPAGSNVIGHVVADSGSTTAVTGNVTVVQATGTNLHAVLDTTSTTAVTQATASNLHTAATLDAETTKVIGTVRVLGNTGAVVDGAPAATAPTNAIQVGATFNTTPATLTNGQMGAIQLDAAENVLVNLKTALPAGANVIGHVVVDASSNVIGHVIVDSGTITTVSAVTAITNALPAGANVIGHVIVDTAPSTAVTNAGTFAVQATLAAATTNVIGTVRVLGNIGAIFDGVPSATAPANAVQAGATFHTTPATLTDGQMGVVQLDAAQNVLVNLKTAIPAGANVIGHVIVDSGTITTVSTVTAVTAITNALPAGSNVIGHVIVDTAPSTAVTNAGTFAVQATLAAATTNVIGTVRCQGNLGAAFDAATAASAPANAVQAGFRGTTALPTAVTDGQLVAGMTDKYGRAVAVLNAPRDLVGRQTTQIASTTTETTIVTQVASVFCDITSMQITNATATAVTVTIKDSTAGTTVLVYDIAANGGISVQFPTPLTQTTVNTNWTATLSVNTVTVDVSVQFVKNK